MSSSLPSILLQSLWFLPWALFSTLPSSWCPHHSHKCAESSHISTCSLDLFYELPAPLSNCLLTTALMDVPNETSKLILFSLNKPDPLPGFLLGEMVAPSTRFPQPELRSYYSLLPFLTHQSPRTMDFLF